MQKTSNFSLYVHRSTSILTFFSDILAFSRNFGSKSISALRCARNEGQRTASSYFNFHRVSILYSCIFTREVLETAPYIKMKCKQDRQCTHNVTPRRFSESLLPWKSNKYSLLVCVCMHERACKWVPGRVGVCLHIHACSLANPACKACAPYCDVICGPSVSTTFWAGPLKRVGLKGLKSCLARR